MKAALLVFLIAGCALGQIPVPGGGGGGGANVANHTIAFSATPTYAPTSSTNGVIDNFCIGTTPSSTACNPTALTANITSSTLSGGTPGQELNFYFKQSASGSTFTVAMPTGFNQACQVSNIYNALTKMSFIWDGTNAQLKSCTVDIGPSQTATQADPTQAPTSGNASVYASSTDNTLTSEDSSGNFYGVVRKNVKINTATGQIGGFGGPAAAADTSGSGTAQTANTSPAFTPVANDCIVYTTTTTNSGAGLTINVNSLGAKSVAIPGASGWTTTLTASIIPANKPLLACYDGTNWDIQQTGTSASGGSNTISGSGLTQYLAYYQANTALEPAYAFSGVASTGATATFSNGSASISATNSFVAGEPVTFTTTGVLPTPYAVNTVYYVIAAGLSGSAFSVSATFGGSAITATSAGSGVQTVLSAPTIPLGIAATTTTLQYSGTLTNGSWTWTPGQLIYVSGSSAGALTAVAPTTAGYWQLPIAVALTATQILILPGANALEVQ